MSDVAVKPMKWADQKYLDKHLRCACCGRKIVGKKPKFVEVIDGGSFVAAPGLNPNQSDAGYMGFFPVGNGCARLYFKGFTHDIG